MVARPLFCVMCLSLTLGWGADAVAQAPASGSSAPLLAVSKGQIPNDTGSDGLTKMTIEKSADLGGDALKVVFSKGDSFGDRQSKVKNWKPFAHVRFNVMNSTNGNVGLAFNVNHRRTTSYQTRAVHAITLKPGKNEVLIGLDELVNVNGSAPDLANVVKWYISIDPEQAPTLYFGDILLEGAEPAAGNTTAGGGTLPLLVPGGGLRVQGTIGNQKVDLTITPLQGAGPSQGVGPQAAKPADVSGDPARLARIRAAKMPKIDKVIAFDTPEADAVLSALEVFPPNNPWNLVVSKWPLHPQSKAMIASVGADKFLRGNEDMCYIIVPPNQPRIDVKLVGYPGESDPGPFPIPDNLPIEGWPKWYSKDGKKLSLADAQKRPPKYEGDRHAIVLDPTSGKLYEFFVMGRQSDGSWAADQSSIFDLKSNKLRPDGWTSSDAAGLPIFPAVVRYDELQRGEIEHALRVTIRRSRREYVYPATHQAGHGTEENLPRMGERFRLRQDFDTSSFSPTVRTILNALKKYGMFVADNGIEWALSIAPDPRIPEIHGELRKVKGSDFEVVEPPPGYVPPAE